ncbi:MAG: hypothetical protein JXA67_15700 [Micromonosporaceae bacterium]|nr:hypothetical protein [Micromonosporaceae bacterium]
MPPVIELESLESNFRDALTALENGIKKVENAFQSLIDKLNETLRNLAFVVPLGALYLAKRLGDAVKKLGDLLRAFLSKCREVLSRGTPIYSMIRVGFQWISDVMNPTSSKEGVIATDASDNLANWKGQAETAYRRKVALQKTAQGGMTANADGIGSWLVDLGTANIAFVVAMIDPLAPIAAKLVEAAIDAGSVFGALESIDSAAEAIGKLLEVAWAELKTQVEQFTTAMNKMFDANKIINGNSAFPNGHWPQAVGTY